MTSLFIILFRFILNSSSKNGSETTESKGVFYMRPGRTQAGMSSYRSPHISFHAFTWDRPKNELRSV